MCSFLIGQHTRLIIWSFLVLCLNTIFEGANNLILNVPKKYQYNSAALARGTARDLVGWVREAGASKDGPEIGLLTWACHNIWLEYRYSMNKEILKKLFPILKRSVIIIYIF